ncbi:putative RING-H2 finger protein ATL69 [Panicum miliaceum]|uniref:RING-H2 finger protein ATL69 n=1 Tax=Panicum miliaceum TaxID=4540 RepID=A0A3L6ST65_PANMI|nr:putative RING-H2 finger protein ATL69 [Panicum miliaceum]
MRAYLRASAIATAPALAPAAAAAGDVGLGYGIAIAVGVLVLVSTVMLISYLCVLTKARAAHAATLLAAAGPAAPSPAAAAAVPGLNVATIDALYPKYPHVYGTGDDGGDCGDPCAICLGEFARGDALRRGPGCGHGFHACCAERWLRVSATCPVCRDSPVATPLAEAVPLAAHAR